LLGAVLGIAFVAALGVEPAAVFLKPWSLFVIG
jgi:hypothetical protein